MPSPFRFLLALLAVLAAALAAPTIAEGPDIRPGLWEFTMSGMQGKGMTQQICFTPEMVKSFKGVAARGDPGSDCKTANESASGKTRSFDIACTKPNVYKARVTVTVDGPDNFTMAQDFAMERAGKTEKGSLKFTYRRIGECKK